MSKPESQEVRKSESLTMLEVKAMKGITDAKIIAALDDFHKETGLILKAENCLQSQQTREGVLVSNYYTSEVLIF